MSHCVPKVQDLIDALEGVEHMRVMMKEAIPERFHYKSHHRIQPVVLLAEEGWTISTVKKLIVF